MELFSSKCKSSLAGLPSWTRRLRFLYSGTSQSVNTGNNASSASLDQSVEIICTTCYIKGLATAELSISDDFNLASALNKTKNDVFDEVQNFTTEVEDYFETYFKSVATNLEDGVDWHDFAFPPLNYSFDMDITPMPDVNLTFQFDNMELYLELNTILGAGATYELNLYTSNTPIGIGAGKDLTLGVVFKVDLLLNVAGTIDISSGLHLELADGLAINIALFSDAVSNIVFNGGQYEFLPVTVSSANVVLSAILRIGIHSGIAVTTPDLSEVTIFNATLGVPQFGGGIEVGVYANLAEFITNVTLAPDSEDCEFQVVQEYQIALGAVAGASVVFDSDTWGPVAQTSIPIWNTALASVCAEKGTKTPAPVSASATVSLQPTAPPARRADSESETVTTKTKITHTGVQCITSVIGNCPNSLQTTTQFTETRTLTTTVAAGEDVTWPETLGVTDEVTATRKFGEKALSFTATSGSPTSYTPPPPPPTSSAGGSGGNGGSGSTAGEIVNGKTGGVSNKVIIGVSVGVGVPVIVAIVAGILYVLTLFPFPDFQSANVDYSLLRRKRKYNAVPTPSFAPQMTEALVAEPYSRAREGGDGFEPVRMGGAEKKVPGVEVTEVGRAK